MNSEVMTLDVLWIMIGKSISDILILDGRSVVMEVLE